MRFEAIKYFTNSCILILTCPTQLKKIQMSTEDNEKEEHSNQQQRYLPDPKTMSSSASTQAIASIGSYCLANMAMTVTNKYVFSVSFFWPEI